ncbi:hypothetical protein BDR06DRAFT_951714 [Suillus hirtellus]|nr:hypothetical protein BDR06DRAFT_951714 [Suillus hirtellus]
MYSRHTNRLVINLLGATYDLQQHTEAYMLSNTLIPQELDPFPKSRDSALPASNQAAYY